MNIDWFTLFAQAANFLILLYLLKKFLFDRIVTAMKKRESRIADRIRDVKKQREDAEQRKKEYEEKLAALEQEEQERIKEAKEEAASLKQELTEKARSEVDNAKQEWLDNLEQQKDTMIEEFRRKAASQIITISERVAADLADRSIEESMIRMFLDKLKDADKQDIEEIRKKHKDEEISAAVETHITLTDKQKTEIEETVRDSLHSDIEVAFEQTGDAAGITLSIDGYRIGWNVKDYLADLEQSWSESFSRPAM